MKHLEISSVAQSGTLLYRRMAFCGPPANVSRFKILSVIHPTIHSSTRPLIHFCIAFIFLSLSLFAADDREAALLRAMASVQNAAERAANDTARPQFHFRAPGNWMNDPNGPIFHRGYYHMFYQHNPYGDAWEHMHWGHARSKDLVHWEHLPIALWPSESKGEKHCFSGCAALNAKGEPMIFYTSIGHPKPECWIALPEDPDLIRWKKFEGNPILTEETPGIPYYDFRDPFIFTHQGRTWMVHGGNLNKAKGGQAVVTLFEADNPDLTKWKYKSILFQHPDPKVVNIECPLFFPMGDKFVLITSPHRACDYFVGTFDPVGGKFTSERSGMLDHSDQFYAPNCLVDAKGRRVLWGWIRGFRGAPTGWNGCLSLPRILSLEDGRLTQHPAPELADLRGVHKKETQFTLNNERRWFPSPNPPFVRSWLFREPAGMRMELIIGFNLKSAQQVGVRLRASEDEKLGTRIEFDGAVLNVAGTKVKLAGDKKKLGLRIYMDNSVLEVFVNGGEECVTRVFPNPPAVGSTSRMNDTWVVKDSLGFEVYAKGGRADVAVFKLWDVASIWSPFTNVVHSFSR